MATRTRARSAGTAHAGLVGALAMLVSVMASDLAHAAEGGVRVDRELASPTAVIEANRAPTGSAYAAFHNLTSRDQVHEARARGRGRGNGNNVRHPDTGFDQSYAYSARPHAPTTVGDRSLSYDLNGNLIGMRAPRGHLRRTLVWDEDDRITEIRDGGQSHRYVYDDSGQRMIKLGPQGETVSQGHPGGPFVADGWVGGQPRALWRLCHWVSRLEVTAASVSSRSARRRLACGGRSSALSA